jgi:hypothetical protein
MAAGHCHSWWRRWSNAFVSHTLKVITTFSILLFFGFGWRWDYISFCGFISAIASIFLSWIAWCFWGWFQKVGECLGSLLKTFKVAFLPYFEELIPYITPMLVAPHPSSWGFLLFWHLNECFCCLNACWSHFWLLCVWIDVPSNPYRKD